eukprot:4162336-Pyramimonas_sp.AAC.1
MPQPKDAEKINASALAGGGGRALAVIIVCASMGAADLGEGRGGSLALRWQATPAFGGRWPGPLGARRRRSWASTPRKHWWTSSASTTRLSSRRSRFERGGVASRRAR